MKIKFTLAAAAVTFLMPGTVDRVEAQEQVVETLVCQSTPGTRATCEVRGEVISAGIQRQLGDGSPCFLNYTWGFAENGIWTGNGCSAEFAVTIEKPASRPVADPEVLRSRLRKARSNLRKARREIAVEKETRQNLEAELAETQAALRDAEAAIPKNATRKKKGKKPLMAIRSVAVCSNKAVREAKKGGAETARVSEIVTARPIQGTWLVIGRLSANGYNGRSSSFFRCWSEKGKIVNYENSL